MGESTHHLTSDQVLAQERVVDALLEEAACIWLTLTDSQRDAAG
jgi:hypothetical protein